jgi:hypothetical protein
VRISNILRNTVVLEMGFKNEKLQYKIQKFWVSEQEIVARGGQ